MRQLLKTISVASLVCLIAAGCGGSRQSAYEDDEFKVFYAFDGPAFRPEAPLDALVLVTLDDRADEEYEAAAVINSESSCGSAEDQDRCFKALTDFVDELAGTRPQARPPSAYFNSNCIMCERYDSYLIAVEADSARVVSTDEALQFLGEVDTAGEAMLVVDKLGVALEVGDGFEIITTDMVCDPNGPRRTVWHVDTSGHLEELEHWDERLGENCDDI